MKNLSRRNLLKISGVIVGAATLGLSPLGTGAVGMMGNAGKKLKIIVAGAHPDDPETACGGTMTLLAAEGHEVVSAYLTRGEAGIHGKTHDEAAAIRSKEAMDACKVMNARAEFLGQIDGAAEITPARYAQTIDFFKKEKPDIVITHWPIDGHRDHRICSVLVYDAWINLDKSFDLYYFEVDTGAQTQNFPPTHFVDITSVIEKKHEACNCHVSQNMPEVYRNFHGIMEKFRGLQANCKYAEAFIKHNQSDRTIG
jgi:LmbE family N-acetylglucosaminyl deacetylase